MEFTPEFISELEPNEVFIFGSNENGNHYGGAARVAFDQFGAKWGTAVGRSGQTYAIPTLDRDMEKVEPEMLEIHLEDLAEYVRENPDLKFYLTKIGCGIAGWSVEEVKKIFWRAFGYSQPKNLLIPKEFTLTIEDFKPVKGTIERSMCEHIGQMRVENAPLEVERMNNQDPDGEWRMDFHEELYCWDECDEDMCNPLHRGEGRCFVVRGKVREF